MTVTCGIDWASDHHDVALVDHEGTLLARARITDDLDGLHQLFDLFTTHGNTANGPIPVAIETSRGLLVACLRATGRPIYAINPMAAARYRDRHTVTRKKSDHLDAMVLANILRTDKAAHRPLPDDSELAQAVAVLARAQQDAVWDRTQAGNKLRSHPREYSPGFLAAFQHNREGISSSVARAVLAAAPTPEQAAKLTRAQLRSLLKKAGRQRGIEAEAERLRDALRILQMRQPPQVEQAKRRGHGPQGQEPASGLGRLRLGHRQPDSLTRRPGPLRPKASRRRPPHRRPTQPLQPHARLYPPLPHQAHPLRRTHRVPRPDHPTTRHRRLTDQLHRMSCPRPDRKPKPGQTRGNAPDSEPGPGTTRAHRHLVKGCIGGARTDAVGHRIRRTGRA